MIIALDFQKRCKDRTEDSPILLSYFLLLLTSYITIHNCRKLGIHVAALSLTELYTLFRFYQFSSSVLLFVLGSHSGYLVLMSPCSSLVCGFSDFSCLWWSWCFRSTSQIFFLFCRMSLNLEFLNVFLMVRQKSWVLGRKTAEL